MSIELSVGSSQGRVAEWHDTIQPDGTRMTTCPNNADVALAFKNEHWVGDLYSSDADKFNEIFEPTIKKFNAKQSKPSRLMGPESSKPERQKSYYDGIQDGTFCHGKGEMQETAVYETVLQLGNKDDNGTTDASFNIRHWYALKQSGREDEASRYAIEHLNDSETLERTKRILHRAVDRIVSMDPEHLIVLRADYHGDEPCGTPNVHVAFTLRATGYQYGMEERVGSVKALAQMGFQKTKDTEYGIVQLHERFREIIEEEMAADAAEYGYDPIKRKAPTGEQRQRSDVDVFRAMAAEKSELDEQRTVLSDREESLVHREADADSREDAVKAREEAVDEKERDVQQREALQKDREELVADRIKHVNNRNADVTKREKVVEQSETRQKETAAQQNEQYRYLQQAYAAMLRLLNQLGDERTEFGSWDELSEAFRTAAENYAADVEAEARSAARADVEKEKQSYVAARKIFESRIVKLEQIPEPFRAWAESAKVAFKKADGTAKAGTVAGFWQQHVEMIRQSVTRTPEQREIIRQADKGLGE